MKKKVVFGMLIVMISLLWINGRSEYSKIKAVEPEMYGEFSITY